ncbi:hypothetical protein [Hasllibacter sp. MH4015]|uniref:hypothetical protein n=1 Tax=Hasllibacter sp. MH4015 TaxID=2854029 RepID=UPI001CD78672|nr:hypothetical protein [Hasllibacter sp. MH4015]
MRIATLTGLAALMVLAGCNSFTSRDTVRTGYANGAYNAEAHITPGCQEGFGALQAGTRICVGY